MKMNISIISTSYKINWRSKLHKLLWLWNCQFTPWFYLIFGHFKNSYFLPKIYFNDHISHFKRVLKVFQADLRPQSKVFRRVQNRPKAWTIVHGLTRFLAILKMPIFLMKFTLSAVLSTVKRFWRFPMQILGQNRKFSEGSKMGQKHGL